MTGGAGVYLVRPVDTEIKAVLIRVEFEDGAVGTYEVEQPRRVLVSVINTDSFLDDEDPPDTIEDVRRFRLDVKVGQSPIVLRMVEP